MIKCVFLIYRAPHLSFDEFASYWENNHSRMAVENAPLMRMRRYVQNHRREAPIAHAFQEGRGCLMGDFDGVAEAWWDSFDEMAAAAGNTPADIAEAILKDEASFIDIKRSIIWFGEEKPFWPPGAS